VFFRDRFRNTFLKGYTNRKCRFFRKTLEIVFRLLYNICVCLKMYRFLKNIFMQNAGLMFFVPERCLNMTMFFLLDVIQIVLFTLGCYYVFISFFSLFRINKKAENIKLNSFALVVAAHNEESVVGEIVESLKSLEYPKDKYRIFVVADNCNDGTAQIARESGATVFERFDQTKRGKGFALEFGFKSVLDIWADFDFFCVFDADNLVEKDFLIHMNRKINEGYHVVQGYIDSKNPSDNWLSFSYSLWYWINNRISQLSRDNAGLGCRLGGTGFAVGKALIHEYGWGATCLAEDIEFTLRLALDDVKVGWAHDAVVLDEKPTDMTVSVRQRQRWTQGIAEVACRYVLPLFRKGIKEKKTGSFHMLMNFFGDTLHLVSLGVLTTVYGLTFFADKNSGVYELFCRPWDEPWKLYMLATVVIMNFVFIVLALYADNKLEKCGLKKMAGFVVYILSWIPIGIMGVLRKNHKEWFHTPHSGKNK